VTAFQGLHPKESKPGSDRATGTPTFTAVLFTIVKHRKQLGHPTTDEWIRKMWHMYTIDYYSAIRKKEIM
jgi:hypothetical protein